MAHLSLRQLPGELHQRLRARAAHNGRSMEAEARAILAAALAPEPAEPQAGAGLAVYAGHGGLRPGVRDSLTNGASLDAADEELAE